MSTSKASAATHVKGSTGSVLVQPSETSNSYFPKGATASTLAAAATPAETPLGSSTTASPYPLSPLDRQYTKPIEDIDVAQQLLKQPSYWSVQGWLQRSAGSGTQSSAEDPEARTRKFEEAKKNLLALAGRF
ncbi:hypothetical protein O1611_g3556 [Lasiodiplodia mahajangana]|uniref:Uncharacterized protein n=1 Tax=Lasiodiplodia mahajangana TaxID=1108764 RepID=A0ACC2JRK5_9PEZI|nr:hypothetical protein O1611_g3556 [Lasiodiplodia mahajangana]